MHHNDRIYVAGHQGLVGSALMRCLRAHGYEQLITRTPQELDLRDQRAVAHFFKKEQPAYVFLAAARVGGILANMRYPADFIYDNIMIQTNVLHAAYEYKVKKLLFLGSSCIYPRNAATPIHEDALLMGPLEPTNQAYAVAKIAGITMCQAYNQQYGTHFIAAMPTNLYGPGDTFDEQWSHVVPALILKMHRAKQEQQSLVTLGGTGRACRELLYVDDCAQALIQLMEQYEGTDLINIGTGIDTTIAELAHLIKEVVNYQGTLAFNPQLAPDGVLKKNLAIGKITALGWHATTPLRVGIGATYEWFLQKEMSLPKERVLHEQL